MNPTALIGLLSTLPLIVLPQWEHLPLWLLALSGMTVVWRYAIFRGQAGAPTLWLRLPLMAGGLGLLFHEYHTLIGAEAGVSLLILLAGFKLLEMRTQRDAEVTCLILLFTLAMNFLSGESLLLALYSLMVTIGIVAILLLLQLPAGVISWRQAWMRVLGMAALAVPLMLILFVFFPRFPPLWSLQMRGGEGHTGMSDVMSPGDIAKLSESTEPAFRVEFDGAGLEKSQMYWRGLVFDEFDGKSWRQSAWMQERKSIAILAGTQPPRDWRKWRVDKSRTQAFSYRVILEPTENPWLFALGYSESPTAHVMQLPDYRLEYREPVHNRLSYQVISYPEAMLDGQLSIDEWRHYLFLPAQGNPEARALAQQWRQSAANVEDYIRRVLTEIRKQNFVYSLTPPLLGDQPIDDFLFRTRTGFCEHYASAFAYLMRAAGVPARVVIGYQGGERSPLAKYWLVRQLDAHAWVEVWQPGIGWKSVDPTAAVAPQRIQKGADSLASQRNYWGQSMTGLLQYGSYRWLSGARHWIDYVNYAWTRDVLNFSTNSQDGLMRSWFGVYGSDLRGLVLMISGAIMGSLIAWWSLRRRLMPIHPIDARYLRFCAVMARRGYARECGEGALHYAERLAQYFPLQADALKRHAEAYTLLRYAVVDNEPRYRVLSSRMWRLQREVLAQ